MSLEEITAIIRTLIQQSIAGQEIESPKIDFKESWYDLHSLKGINEFMKDTSSIANTFGPDGFIIIGYNEKKKVFKEIKFSDSRLRDTSEIHPLLSKHLNDAFDLTLYSIEIESHGIHVLHIPPSLNKPHVIKNYQTFYPWVNT